MFNQFLEHISNPVFLVCIFIMLAKLIDDITSNESSIGFYLIISTLFGCGLFYKYKNNVITYNYINHSLIFLFIITITICIISFIFYINNHDEKIISKGNNISIDTINTRLEELRHSIINHRTYTSQHARHNDISRLENELHQNKQDIITLEKEFVETINLLKDALDCESKERLNIRPEKIKL
jgi:hypothetical protein